MKGEEIYTMNTTSTPNTILRLHTVSARTGLARSTIYLRISQGTFPKQISLGGRTVGWVESEIELWLSNCITESRNKKC